MECEYIQNANRLAGLSSYGTAMMADPLPFRNGGRRISSNLLFVVAVLGLYSRGFHVSVARNAGSEDGGRLREGELPLSKTIAEVTPTQPT